jgi:hypothetical protein
VLDHPLVTGRAGFFRHYFSQQRVKHSRLTIRLTAARLLRVRVQRLLGQHGSFRDLANFLSTPLSHQWFQLQKADIAVLVVGDQNLLITVAVHVGGDEQVSGIT